MIDAWVLDGALEEYNELKEKFIDEITEVLGGMNNINNISFMGYNNLHISSDKKLSPNHLVELGKRGFDLQALERGKRYDNRNTILTYCYSFTSFIGCD